MAEHVNKDLIIKAFLDCVFYKSTGSTSLSNIADRLHVKKASLYNHFNGRDDIIFQTTQSCSEYIKEINFIPENYESVAERYPAATVLKGIVSRYVKMSEKSPLFQIYTFVNEQKYFSTQAAKILIEEKEKFIEQTGKILTALVKYKKLSLEENKIQSASKWFVHGVNDILNFYLMKRKEIVMQNPETGDGELFTLEADNEGLEKINSLVEEFCTLFE